MLVGLGDDAGVFMLSKRHLIVETVDVITPVVNDPFTFGSISAVNSLSDIYAMGGSPKTALAILGFPSCDYEPPLIKEILKGAVHLLRKAGVSLIGGHSFENNELKFGLSVTGTIKKDKILRLKGAIPDDVLILTKPIGVGVLSTALKARKIKEEEMLSAINSMLLLNDKASTSSLKAGATSCTDITGFGLLGHAYNMVRDGEVDFLINIKDIPIFDSVRDFIAGGIIPEGAYNNLKFLGGKIDVGITSEDERLLLCDPQTSGGLLITLPEKALKDFASSGVWFKRIGKVITGKGIIRLL